MSHGGEDHEYGTEAAGMGPRGVGSKNQDQKHEAPKDQHMLKTMIKNMSDL